MGDLLFPTDQALGKEKSCLPPSPPRGQVGKPDLTVDSLLMSPATWEGGAVGDKRGSALGPRSEITEGRRRGVLKSW